MQCGEAFAAWLPGWGVPFSYAVAISYVLTDTYDKWARARKQAKAELDSIDLDPAVNEGRSATPLRLGKRLESLEPTCLLWDCCTQKAAAGQGGAGLHCPGPCSQRGPVS